MPNVNQREHASTPEFFETEMSQDAAYDLSALLDELDVRVMRTSLFDTERSICLASWRLASSGVVSDELAVEPDLTGGLVEAMATIVHLNNERPTDTMCRMLDDARAAIAWQLDERYVAVSEAVFRTPRTQVTRSDFDLFRLITSTGIGAGDFRSLRPLEAEAGRVFAELVPLAATATSKAATEPGPFGEIGTSKAGSTRPPTDKARGHGRRAYSKRGAMVLLGAGIICTAVLGSWNYSAGVDRDERLALQVESEAVMLQTLSRVSAGGDYGEVQDELDKYSKAKHFNGAVVTNSRHLVIARSGSVEGVRIGEPVPPAQARTAMITDMPANGSGGIAQLLLWKRAEEPGLLETSTRTLTVAGMILSILAVGWGVAILGRGRFRDSGSTRQSAMLGGGA